ncbi:hypothetical protein Tco_0871805 [Tanacetum coccineum]
MQECKNIVVQALNANLAVTECSGTVSVTQNVSSCSGNECSIKEMNDKKVNEVDIRPTHDTESLEQVDNNDYNVFIMEKEHPE